MEPSSYPKLYFYRRIVQAKLFIDEHFAGDMDLYNIAGEAYYSKFHFARKFKEVYQRTPHQYLIFVRTGHAKKLLQQGLPVIAVSTTVGFKELSSFSRSFKQLTGLSPSAYQQQQLKAQEAADVTPLSRIPHCFAYQYGWTQKEQV